MQTDQRIRVAICGGGLAGSALLLGLLQYPHLDVHIFESANMFKGEGATIGITSNAARALEMLAPTAINSLSQADAVEIGTLRLMGGSGPDSGAFVGDLDRKSLVHVVTRRNLLHEMLKDVPADLMHSDKALVKVEQGEEIVLHFKDGSSRACDVLIGADGIHSRVRRIILGEDDPASNTVFTQWASIRALKPYDEARDVLGADLINKDDPHQYGWCGKNGFFLHDVLSGGEMVSMVAGMSLAGQTWDPNEWVKPVTEEDVRTHFQDWMPLVRDKAIPYLCKEDPLIAMSTWEHPHARTYARGAICIIGDAAHATSPMQASGGGMAIEDAMILSSLLGRARSKQDVIPALRAYSEIRLPRTQKIVDSSRETGHIFAGHAPDVGLEPAKLADALLHRWDSILDIDLDQHLDAALRRMEDFQSEQMLMVRMN